MRRSIGFSKRETIVVQSSAMAFRLLVDRGPVVMVRLAHAHEAGSHGSFKHARIEENGRKLDLSAHFLQKRGCSKCREERVGPGQNGNRGLRVLGPEPLGYDATQRLKVRQDVVNG